MKLLSRAEEIILLAVIKLEDEAYGITIRDFIRQVTGDEWSLASIYEPLNKLTRKGFVRKHRGEPTPERGGRSKCLYSVTPTGRQALLDILAVHEGIWSGIGREVLDCRGLRP